MSDIIVAIVAAYAAILTTYSVIVGRREKKRRLKVDVTIGFPAYGRALGALSVILTGINTGHRPITLAASGFQMPDDEKATILRPEGTKTLPYELTEGKSFTVWMEAKPLAELLCAKGLSGKVEIVGWFRDQVGEVFTSDPWEFDVDQSYEV